MGIGEKIEAGLIKYRTWRKMRVVGPIGDFYRNGGQEQLYDNLPITPDDLVIDGGGYQGEWTDEMLCRYGCRSIIFEPVPQFAESLRQRYARNSRVEVCEAALSDRSGHTKITFSADGSSTFASTDNAVTFGIRLVDFAAFLRERNVSEIACLKLNIEGGEYEVLREMAEQNLLGAVRSFLIQFHIIDPDCTTKRAAIQNALAKTHKSEFDYPFVWERWDRIVGKR